MNDRVLPQCIASSEAGAQNAEPPAPAGADGARKAATRVRCAQLLAQLHPLLSVPSDAATAAFWAAAHELKGLGLEHASAELVECLLTIAHYFYLSNQAPLALPAVTEAVLHSRTLADQRLLRKALTFTGVMRKETGDLPGATEALSEALQIARALGEAELEAPVWNNLGAALMNAAQYADAMRCFDRAARLAHDGTELKQVEPQALANLAHCALHLHDVRTGIRSVRRSIDLNPDPESASDCLARVIAESNYARLLLEIGEVGHAEEHSKAARAFASRAPSARADYVAAMTSGLIDVHAQRTDVGLTRLKRALEHARNSVRTEVRDALSACVAGYEAAGQHDMALVYLHELLALNRDGRAAQLLAPLEALVAELGSETAAADLRLDRVMTGQAARLTAAIDKCLAELIAGAVDNALRAGHDAQRIFRVGRLAELFARSLGWQEAAAAELALAVRLMDVGSIVVPDPLLRKPRGLSVGEKKLVAEHTGFGAELLQRARLALLQPCIPVAKFHHERWDGTGPWGLAGEGIPIAARIAALADTLDALTHRRPWRAAVNIQVALRTIVSESASHFDPTLARQFAEFVQAEFWRCDGWDEWLSAEAHENSYVKARMRLDRMIQEET